MIIRVIFVVRQIDSLDLTFRKELFKVSTMFTLPPRPPKDYYLDDVTPSLRSSAQFTPTDQPRVTQTNFAKHSRPIEYADDEHPEKVTTAIHPKILEKMMLDQRYSWLTSPGKEDFFIHDMFKKFTTDRVKGMYDPRYMHKEKIFNRSYQFELDCIEGDRLEKLRVKNQTEEANFEGSFQRLVKKQIEKETPPIPIVPCKAQPPVWWPVAPQPDKEDLEIIDVPPVFTRSSARWVAEPNLTAFVQDNPCQRKKDMLLVGQPFKTEACNWYYKMYPPPNIKTGAKHLK